MKKSTVLFIATTTACLGLSLYNKKKGNPATGIAEQICAETVTRLSAPLKKAILIKAALSFGAVMLATALCKKAV